MEKEVRHSPVFSRAFTGFTVIDPETGKILADVNGDHYFTPASTTKILTLYTCLNMLGDSVPALQIQRRAIDESARQYALLLRGTGDPTFLSPFFQHWQGTFTTLKNRPEVLQLLAREPAPERFGPGWAWDDYPYGFQAERTVFPMYGGVVRYVPTTGFQYEIQPPVFREHFINVFQKGGFADHIIRSEFENEWRVPGLNVPKGEKWLPFTAPDRAALLADTLGKSVEKYTPYPYELIPNEWQTLYSTPLDTVLRRMMYQSDNFIAEQMLLLCAGKKFDLLQQDTLINWMLDSVLNDLPQRPRWVDGSGLSRYNLISPQDLSAVLLRLWREQPHERLLSLFPKGGVDGTLSDWYAGKDGKPYVFAKSGSMSGVTCLSGYVRTKHDKFLIFTFMTNHFVGSSRAWKEEMQKVIGY